MTNLTLKLPVLYSFILFFYSQSNIAQCDTLKYSYLDTTICVGDTLIILELENIAPQYYYSGSQDYIPDGSGLNYTSNINVSGNNGSIITSNQDIELCIDIEHSYLGDLEIMLTSPNGVDLNIINSYTGSSSGLFPGGFGGGGTFLGGANDTSSAMGNCERYCFSNSTIALPSLDSVYTTTAATGASIGNMVLPGKYNPEEDFSSFINSPIDGTWTLTIRDNLSMDDGWICNWSLNMGISNYQGSWNTSIELSDSTITNPYFFPSSPTTYSYLISDSLGGCRDTFFLDVNFPTSSASTTIIGSSLVGSFSSQTYSVAYDSNMNYIWSISNGTINSGQGTNQVDVQWSNSPTGTLSVLAFDSCSQAMDTLNITIGTLEIIEIEKELIISPNPSKNGTFNLQATTPLKTIEVYSISGTPLWRSPKLFNFNNQINLSHLTPGTYLLKIETVSGKITYKKIIFTSI